MSAPVSGMTEENSLTEPAKQAIRAYMKQVSGLTDENTLTQSAQQAVRKYMLSLITLPASVLAVVSALAGFFFHDVVYNNAYNNAFNAAFSGFQGRMIEQIQTIAEQRSTIKSVGDQINDEKESLGQIVAQTEMDSKMSMDRIRARDDESAQIEKNIKARDDESSELQRDMKAKGGGIALNTDQIATSIMNNPDYLTKIGSLVEGRLAKLEQRVDGLKLVAIPRPDLTAGNSCHTPKDSAKIQATDPTSLVVMSGNYSGVGCNVSNVNYFKELQLSRPK
jgi:hypothetical protein